MSSVSSIGSDLANLYRALQQAGNQNAAAASASDPAQAAATAANAQQSAAAKHHRHRGHGLAGEIQSAVTTALQSPDAKADPNKAVEDAIAKVLASHQQPSGTTSATRGDPSSASPAASPDADKQAFLQLLQSYGIDGQQFRQDMQAALKDVKGGGVDFSRMFQSLPPGSSVDTTV